MPWFKVDDGFYSHEKVLNIPRRDRMAAAGLWTLCGAWSAQRLTDGRIPAVVVDELGGTKRLADLLVKVGLWKRSRGAYLFHNWTEFQPTKADVETEREAAKARMRKARERKRAGQGSAVTETFARTSANTETCSPEVRQPDPTRPDPTPNKGGHLGGEVSPERARSKRPPRQCQKHEGQTDAPPCGPCKDARTAHDAWQAPVRAVLRCDEHHTNHHGTCPGCAADRKASA